jgi:hypothetical protein
MEDVEFVGKWGERHTIYLTKYQEIPLSGFRLDHRGRRRARGKLELGGIEVGAMGMGRGWD